jgi:WD40 repeat protein
MKEHVHFAKLLTALLLLSGLVISFTPAAAQDDPIILDAHEEAVWDVAFSPDGATIASCDEDGIVILWDVATGEPTIIEAHGSAALAVAFSPDGALLATGSKDDTVVLWDTETLEVVQTLTHSDNVTALAFNGTGTVLAAGSKDNKVWLWDVATGNEITQLRGPDDLVTGVAFSPDDQMIAGSSEDGTVRLWDALTGEELHVLEWHEGVVYDVAFFDNGETLTLYSGGEDGMLIAWPLDALDVLDATVSIEAHARAVTAVAANPVLPYLATGSGDHTVKLWGLPNLDDNPIATYAGHTWVINALAFSPDGETLASAAGDNTVRLWQMPLGLIGTEEGAGDAARLDAAREVYAANCAACHGETGAEGDVGPALAMSDRVAAMWAAGALREVLVNGVEGTAMPAFDGTLEANDIDNLVLLLESWQEE